MTLEVHPIESTDAGACVDIRIERLGSLVIGRPIPDPKSGYRDGRIASIERDLNDRPHVHNLKIIDTEMKNRIIAYARWEIHEFGRPSSNVSATPKDNAAKGIDEVQELLELRHDMNVYFRARDKEIGNKPHILLSMLVTANEHEKRGAGTLLLQWGIKKSQESGLPIYLESSPEALTLYRNNGFEQDGEIKVWDRDRFGFTGPNTLIPMVRWPK